MQIPLRQSLIDACLIGPESPTARKDQRYALEGRTLGSQVSFSPRRSVVGDDEVHDVGVVGDGCAGAIGETLPCGPDGSLRCMEGGRGGIFPSWARQRRDHMAEILRPDRGLLAGEHIGFDVAKVVSSPLLVGMSCSYAHVGFALRR